MKQNYIIFAGENQLHLTAKRISGVKIESNSNTETIQDLSEIKNRIGFYIDEFTAGNIKQLTISGPSTTDLMEWTQQSFDQRIMAGGGIIVNDRGELLVIFRKGKWDLPKGKLERGETTEEGAVREVKEETGLIEVKVASKFTTTFHTYKLDNKNILKETVWFAMTASQEEFTPEAAENIEEVKWVSKDQLPEIYKNSYQSIIDILGKFVASTK